MKKSDVANRIALISVLILTFFIHFSCTKDDKLDTSSAALSSLGFNYENKSDMRLNLQFIDSYERSYADVMVKIYTQNPYLEDGITLNKAVSAVIKGVTDANGVFQKNVPVAGHLENIYIVVDNLLYNHFTTIKKANNYTATIYPMGYGVLKPKVTTRSATDPMQYTRATPAMPFSSKNWVLGTYNATDGLPDYLTTNDAAPGTLITRLSNDLPEHIDQYALRATNNYFANTEQANVHVVDYANVWVTFLSEGAGVNNSVGYFYYPSNTIPTDTNGINKRILIFPNSSAAFSGGALNNGKRVKLKYQDPTTGTWGDIFPPNTTISWYLVTSGWWGSSYGLDNSFLLRHKFQYSIPAFNAGGAPQTILLFDGSTQKIILAFEDVSTGEFPAGGSGKVASDKDYNDVIFAVTANPIAAINTTVIAKVKDNSDSDGDGIPNANDDYPNDINRAFNNYYPGATTYGSLSFEDNWPAREDYDFNDLVLDYRITYVTNAVGTVKDVEILSRVDAIGAMFQNGFAWELNADQSNVSTITTTYTGPGNLFGNGVFDIHAKGYENGQSENRIVIPFFDNAFTLFGAQSIPNYVNTVLGAPYHTPVGLTKKVTFTTPVTVASLGSFPFNPFLIVNKERGREVHKAGQPATSKANLSYFGTKDDRSNRTSLWYVGTQSFPWVLDTPIQFEHPVENTNITSTFLKFSDFASTAGVQATDWYSNTNSGYRDNTKIYKPPF